MLSPTEVLVLARTYAQATGLALSSVAGRALGAKNEKAFARLERGQGVSTRTLERAELWLLTNWPENVLWPPDVPGGPVATVVPPRKYVRAA
jgi:hypothetical protein